MNRPQIRAVAFDFDGLLVNTEELYETVGDLLLQRRGHRLEEALLRQMIGRPSKVALPIMIDWYDLNDTVEQLERETDEIFAEQLPHRLRPMPGVMELLDWLESQGVPKVVTTSSRPNFVRQVLGQLGWEERFLFTLTAHDVQRGKPDPEIYLTAARRLGVAKEHLLVLEDSENGCRAAVAAGSCCIAVPHDRTADHDFSGAKLIADTLADPRVYRVLQQTSRQRNTENAPSSSKPRPEQ